MKHPIKLIIKKGSILKNGTAPIYLQYCYSGQRRTLIQTGVFIPPRFWNKKSCRILDTLPLEYGNANILQKKISEKKNRADELLDYAHEKKIGDPSLFLKENLNLINNWKIEQLTETPRNTDLYANIDDFRESQTGFAKPNTMDTINQMKAHLKAFEKFRKQPLTLDSFDSNFYEEFMRFLTYDIIHLRANKVKKGFKINTIVKIIKYIKTFLRDRMRKKIIPFMDLGDYKAPQEMVDSVYLSWKEISIIYHLDLSTNSKLITCRDLFVLDCLTGLRFSDYSDIKPEELRDGMLYVTQKKNDVYRCDSFKAGSL